MPKESPRLGMVVSEKSAKTGAGDPPLSSEQELGQIGVWYEKNISYSIGPETARSYSRLFQSKARALLNEGNASSPEEAFLETYRGFYEHALGPFVVGWAVMALKTFQNVQREVDPNTKLWWLPRDAYPGMWAAEVLSPSFGLDPSINQAVHINRLNLGIKDEIDPATKQLVDKTPDEYRQVASYARQQIGDSKIIIIADSFQYAYMLEALKNGKDSFIAKAGNVGAAWINNSLPSEILDGIVSKDTTLLPVSFYSHLCGGLFRDTVPAYLNYLAMSSGHDLSAQEPKLYLEAIADVMEATVCGHNSAQKFRTTTDGQIVPEIESTDDSLAVKFSKAAKAGISSAALSYSEVIRERNWRTYAEMQQKHLKKAVSEFDKARQGEESLFVAATAPSLSKRQALFAHVLKQGDWLQIAQATRFISKPGVLS
ncbi:MAG: hypothetical protein Q7R51_02075 [bacterium]|nr:hypothetical protein [bacterium]